MKVEASRCSSLLLLFVIALAMAFACTEASAEPAAPQRYSAERDVALRKEIIRARGERQRPRRPAHMDFALSLMSRAFADDGLPGAWQVASLHGLDVDGTGVIVTLKPRPGCDTGMIDFEELDALGCTILGRSRHFVDARVPLGALTSVTGCYGVGLVSRLLEVEEEETSEGVALTRADGYHAQGHYGAGITVAVIDRGFGGLFEAQVNGDIPMTADTLDFTGTGVLADGSHGTAVTEVVHDMAPGAHLMLLKVNTVTEWENAAAYCISRGVDVINTSLGIYTAAGDGTCEYCSVVEDAYANGIFWTKSAGNAAHNHYQALFTDAEPDGWHDFAPGDASLSITSPSADPIQIILKWDGWPVTTEDYDLFVYDELWNYVTSSENLQWPSGHEPLEQAFILSPVPGALYHVCVASIATSCDHPLEVFIPRVDLHVFGEYHVHEGSLTCPADGQHAFTVGAINVNSWPDGPIAYYSSWGPTDDGRVKPDLTALDACETFTMPIACGTSFAAPHAAGAAALVWSAIPGVVTVDDVWDWLTENAIDIGATGQDNIYGHGLLDLPPDTPVGDSFYAVANGSGSAVLRWTVASLEAVVGFTASRSVSREGPYTTLTEVPLKAITPGYFEDSTVTPGLTFWYLLRAVMADGSEPIVGSPAAVTIPGELAVQLRPPTPNPSSESAVLRFNAPSVAQPVTLSVHDISGRRVAALLSDVLLCGPQLLTWDLRDDSGAEIASGVYLVRLVAGSDAVTQKLLVLR